MDTISKDRIDAVMGLPEVQNLVERLGQFGLGVCVPHMHTVDDVLIPLPAGIVQFEEDLRVSFVAQDDSRVTEALPVSWVWQGGVQVVGRCRQGHGDNSRP